MPPRYYLKVPYPQKDEAKSLGARWDAVKKMWYCPDKRLLSRFARWFPTGPGAPDWAKETGQAKSAASRSRTVAGSTSAAWRSASQASTPVFPSARAAPGSGGPARGPSAGAAPSPARPKQPSSSAVKDLPALSVEQRQFVEAVVAGKNVLVDACIGSGKTTAIQAVCREMPGARILYLTYNRLLKEDAQSKIPRRVGLTVTNYHGLAASLLVRNGVECGVSEMIRKVVELGLDMKDRWDLLLVDEYQDITEDIADLLLYIQSENPDIQIAAVGDMDQKIYDRTTLDVRSFMPSFLGEYVSLQFTRCFRLNAEQAARLGRIWEKPIQGVNPDCAVSVMNLEKAVGLLKEEEPRDILCLGPRNGTICSVLNRLEADCPEKFNKETVYASIREENSTRVPTADAAIFTTYDSAKGMERKACVLFDYTPGYWAKRIHMTDARYEILRNIFCVAASRGKEQIIYVQNGEELIDEGTLRTPFFAHLGEKVQYHVEIMFDFKFDEHLTDCLKWVERRRISAPDQEDIGIRVRDGLIDLTPCIRRYQVAVFFDNYNVDDALKYAAQASRRQSAIGVPADAGITEKILVITAYDVGYDRYVTQVRLPFVTPEQDEALRARLGSVFSGDEAVQVPCRLRIHGAPEIEILGQADVIKDDVVYELAYDSALDRVSFLRLAFYLFALQKEAGILWNVRTGEKWEVRVPLRKEFFRSVLLCVTRGAVSEGRVDAEYLSEEFRKTSLDPDPPDSQEASVPEEEAPAPPARSRKDGKRAGAVSAPVRGQPARPAAPKEPKRESGEQESPSYAWWDQPAQKVEPASSRGLRSASSVSSATDVSLAASWKDAAGSKTAKPPKSPAASKPAPAPKPKPGSRKAGGARPAAAQEDGIRGHGYSFDFLRDASPAPTEDDAPPWWDQEEPDLADDVGVSAWGDPAEFLPLRDRMDIEESSDFASEEGWPREGWELDLEEPPEPEDWDPE